MWRSGIPGWSITCCFRQPHAPCLNLGAIRVGSVATSASLWCSIPGAEPVAPHSRSLHRHRWRAESGQLTLDCWQQAVSLRHPSAITCLSGQVYRKRPQTSVVDFPFATREAVLTENRSTTVCLPSIPLPNADHSGNSTSPPAVTEG